MYFLVLAAASAASSRSDARSLQALHDLGACVVDETPRAARDVLAMDYRSPDYAQKLKAMGERSGRCMARASNVAIQRRVVCRIHCRSSPQAGPGAKETREPHRLRSGSTAVLEARGPLEEVHALCTALRAPKDTAALFQTLPATPGESAAISSLAPALGECVATGTKAELNKPAIRSLLALAAYGIATNRKTAADEHDRNDHPRPRGARADHRRHPGRRR